MKEKIKNLRVSIDGLAQLTKELKPIDRAVALGFPDSDMVKRGFYNSKEVEKATDSLYLAKAWLGKVLGALGSESPYPKDGTRKTIEDIEPTADSIRILEEEKKYIADKDWNLMNHIEKVDWLRQEIQKIILRFWEIYKEDDKKNGCSLSGRKYRFWLLVEQHLGEARFWLGFELERIREEK